MGPLELWPYPMVLGLRDAPDHPGPLHSETGEEPDLSHGSQSGEKTKHLKWRRSEPSSSWPKDFWPLLRWYRGEDLAGKDWCRTVGGGRSWRGRPHKGWPAECYSGSGELDILGIFSQFYPGVPVWSWLWWVRNISLLYALCQIKMKIIFRLKAFRMLIH